MFWNKLLQLVLGGSIMMAQPVPVKAPEAPITYIKPSVDELLTYECGRNVTTMLYNSDQPGPVFSNGLLLVSSVEADDGTRLLIVNAGAGTFSMPLERDGVNRLRFWIPTEMPGGAKEFFISYMHGYAGSRSRVFEYSIHKAPLGKDELDYIPMRPTRAEKLVTHLEYGIFETSKNMVTAFREGRLTSEQLQKSRAENCEHIARAQPEVGRILKTNLDRIAVMTKDTAGATSSRMPASVNVRTVKLDDEP